MAERASKGYSFLIRPFQVLVDLCTLCLITYYFTNNQAIINLYLHVSMSWLLAALFINFYDVYRFTSVVEISILLFKQALLMVISLFTYFGFVDERIFNVEQTFLFVATTMCLVGTMKLGVYYALKQYRSYFGGNKRRIIVFGNSVKTKELISFFNSKSDMGYYVMGKFSSRGKKSISEGIDFLKTEKIDELYCAMEEIDNDQINEIVNYCDENEVVLKFIPSESKLPVVNFHTDYYHYLPVVSIPKMPLHLPQNIAVKRFVDVAFSFLVLVFILSWLVPILFILIKIESRGPLFYKHRRNGINYGEFTCYKFRSLRKEGNENRMHVSKEDDRVTKIGRFLRRTSIDELPQFYNVLRGDMSIVGPRPHIPRYTKAYADKIDKYEFVFRHSVKPGITGLAQTKGYRGEIKSDNDIINRIKYDVFYIQNWSLAMDVNIIFNTIVLLIKGQERAY